MSIDTISREEMSSFRALVLKQGREHYRDLAWRRTCDPYAIWISEVMLQQTQVARVEGRWQHWMEHFPTVDALASASSADVLEEWQGMGYNRRALALWRAACEVSATGGVIPREVDKLVALPGIGPATAAGIRAFAFNLPGVYLETNVRTVFIHELFPQETSVHDKQLIPLVHEACPPDSSNPDDDPRTWYLALLDYGAYLKRTIPNPSRRSASYSKQSKFEGSHRQLRSTLLRLVLAQSVDFDTLVQEYEMLARKEGRNPVPVAEIERTLHELKVEGFCHLVDGIWQA